MSNFISRKHALEKLGIHYHTLYSLAKKGEIETIMVGRNQMYNVEKYLNNQGIKEEKIKRKICYCRVSSYKQKEDLKRQIIYMKELYPEYEIISDIGSGLNYNREGLQKIIEYGIKGELEILVIAYKDRLARFGFELIEKIINKYSNGKIIILNKEEEKTPYEEITKDIISIMNVYAAKINGLRKYNKPIKDAIEKEKLKN
jgi:putative resolvase